MSTFALARSQFIRALDIIESTQLTIFAQRALTPRSTVLGMLDDLTPLPLNEAVVRMQALLNDHMAEYNDPFANYISPAQHKVYTQRRTGGFVGLGLKFRANTDDYPLVIGALLGGPLERLDVQPGDKILSVGESNLEGLSSKDITSAMRGEPGSSVPMILQRNRQRITLQLKRQAVQLHYARAEVLENGIGYIRISRFGGKTHIRVKQLLQNLLLENITGIVLDLRDNPGGSTRAARNIMSYFDRAAWVFCEKYKTGAVKRLPREGEWLTDLPVAVLINEYSQSSAEILAGALQDYKRATLVGSPSYGKGLIQKVFPLQQPIGGAVRTTIAMYGTPSHRLLHGRGLLPDIYVTNAPERLFRETGSVNISAAARKFRRELRLNDIGKRLPKEVVAAYALLPDSQLQVAINHLKTVGK